MFSNTPVGTHRMKQQNNRIHGPPGDQPSHPIQHRSAATAVVGEVTGARTSNIDSGATRLSQSVDDAHISGIIASGQPSILDSDNDDNDDVLQPNYNKQSPDQNQVSSSHIRQYKNTRSLNSGSQLGPPDLTPKSSNYSKFQ